MPQIKQFFIIFGGLPGSGKTSIAREVAIRLNAVYLRIDTIETAIKTTLGDAKEAGYVAAYAVAKDNLLIGNTVIADSVNSINITRQAYRDIANEAGVKYLEVEVICSDLEKLKNRIETRKPDIVGHTPPTWKEVQNREYQPWKVNGLVLDTAKLNVDECINQILACTKIKKPLG